MGVESGQRSARNRRKPRQALCPSPRRRRFSRSRGGPPGPRGGHIQIDTRDEHSRFDLDDLDLLAAVAGPVSVAIENVHLHETAVRQADLEREARDARAVQLALIPDRKPDLPGYEFWHYYEPARYVGRAIVDAVRRHARGRA